jgi:hypothetical protein
MVVVYGLDVLLGKVDCLSLTDWVCFFEQLKRWNNRVWEFLEDLLAGVGYISCRESAQLVNNQEIHSQSTVITAFSDTGSERSESVIGVWR